VHCAPGHDPISSTEFSDIRPRSFHGTGGIHAGDEWKGDARAAAEAPACFRIGRIDTRVSDPDQYFTLSRLGDRHIFLGVPGRSTSDRRRLSLAAMRRRTGYGDMNSTVSFLSSRALARA
jgi:hypothetical protein